MELKKHIHSVRAFREALLADSHRPGYHFALPEDRGLPGDPNALFFAGGRYHMFYLYCRQDKGCAWGHVSSLDMLHWRWHPDAVVIDEEGAWLCSGGGFVDKDGTPYIVCSTGFKTTTGIKLYRGVGRHFDRWEPVGDFLIETPTFGLATMADENGVMQEVGTQDPSNLWEQDGYYYMLTGNYFVLHKYLDKEDGSTPPADGEGDWADLFRSDDLVHWEFVHRFYDRDHSNQTTASYEDSMCACFLPLPDEAGHPTDRHLLIFISHTNGTQYYIGRYDTGAQRFLPEAHGRLCFCSERLQKNSVSYSAPEALLTPDGRLVNWGWMPFEYGKSELWEGVYALPRELWLNPDGSLGQAPLRELERLQYNPVSHGSFLLHGIYDLSQNANGFSCHLRLQCDNPTTPLTVRVLDNGDTYTDVRYDPVSKLLSIDATHCDAVDAPFVTMVEEAPLQLDEGEPLTLDVYVDNRVVEVFANRRQAICRMVAYAEAPNAAISLRCDSPVSVAECALWEMMPTNPY